MTRLRRLSMQFKEALKNSEIANNTRLAIDLLRLLQFSEDAFSKIGYTIKEAMENLRKGNTFLGEIRYTLKKISERKGEETNNYFLLFIEKLRKTRRATYKQLLEEIEKATLEIEKVLEDPDNVSEIGIVYSLLNDICSVVSRSSFEASERLRLGLFNAPYT
nr:hypothetical protein [Candidatus Freyarchaeota archaeon]